MAPVLAARQSNGFEPPPSSILATHVVHGRGVPDFDQDNFNQLLAEALGSDEQGNSNLGSDVAVNHKLICIIFQVGIERVLEDNPFQSTAAAGRATSQLKTCLEVLQLAIERSPQVLFVRSDPQGNSLSGQACPLYCWLVPRLLPLVGTCLIDETRDAVLEVFNAMLEADRKGAYANSTDSVVEYMRVCVSGKTPGHVLRLSVLIPPALLTAAATARDVQPRRAVVIDPEDLAAGISTLTSEAAVSIPSLKFPSLRRLSIDVARVLRLLSRHSQSTKNKLQFRKLFSRFRQFVDENESILHDGDQNEVLATPVERIRR